MKCTNCGFENAAEARFCENCGHPMERHCPNCGQPVSAAARFCANCGYNLSKVPTAASPSLASLRQAAPPALKEKVRAAGTALEGERKLVTVLFADVVGSVELAEAMDPEDWREVVTGVHGRVSEAVHRYEGHVAQLLGDGVLAFFGAPLTHEDDAERAVRAALAILAAIRQYAGELSGRGLRHDLQMRVGINTGQVVVGNVGSDLHLEYLAIGDTVNLAARLQTAADPDHVLITENTQRLLGGLFGLEDKGRMMLKGKAEPVHVYCVLTERRGAVRQRGIAGLTSPIVGRQRELTTLRQVTAELLSGRGAIVSIVGEAGLGKSRLVAEWRKESEAMAAAHSRAEGTEAPAVEGAPPGLLWVEGRCLSYEAALPFHLATGMLRALLQVGPEATAEEVEARVARSCAERLEAEKDEVCPFLAHMLGLPLAEEAANQIRYLDAGALQMRYVSAYRAYLRALAHAAPVVMVADDIHWADQSSAELGTQILGLASEVPIVFVLVARPDAEAPGMRLIAAAREVTGIGSIELHLAPLTDQDSHILISNLLRVAALSQGTRETILAKAEGNPFYVEEVVRMLIDRGGIEQQDGQWVATRELRNIDIPDTLQGVIMARIDRLPEEAKRTLQVASVIGRRFQARVLEMVLGDEDGTG